MSRTDTILALVLKPIILVPLVVIVTALGVTLPWVVGYGPYEQQAFTQQIDREDGLLCEKFGFAAGTQRIRECKTDLADLRLRHEERVLSLY